MSRDLSKQAEGILDIIQLTFHQVAYEQEISPVSSKHNYWDERLSLELSWPLEALEQRLAGRVFAYTKVSAHPQKRGKWKFEFLIYAQLRFSAFQGKAVLETSAMECDLARHGVSKYHDEIYTILGGNFSKYRTWDGDPGILFTNSWVQA